MSDMGEARDEEPLRIWWNKNLHHKISPSKLAAHAAHAALNAYGIKYTHPIVVLAAGKAKVEAMPIAIRDAGRTELAPGTLTTGVEKSWQASRKVDVTDEMVIAAIAAHFETPGDDDVTRMRAALTAALEAQP